MPGELGGEGRAPLDPVAIDVGGLLRGSVASLYSHLVTRPTGRAVRHAIERQLADLGEGVISVIDLRRVAVLDVSCADEVIAKLLRRYLADDRPREAFFVFRGVAGPRRELVETVLRRHALALVAEGLDGRFGLVGDVSPEEVRAWRVVEEKGRLLPGEAAGALGVPRERDALERLAVRRLVYRDRGSGTVVALSALARALL